MKQYTCIICPNGCEITAERNADGKFVFSGALCRRGEEYVRQEMTDPRRTIATSVRVVGGEQPLASVRLTAPIPRGELMRAMEILRSLTLTAPVQPGQIVLSHLLGYDTNVIITRGVEARPH
ncbi:MAG: DUF1667 domain-containing protein [Eubacteriales bacterium]|jgi:CxxC motif-containing protein